MSNTESLLEEFALCWKRLATGPNPVAAKREREIRTLLAAKDAEIERLRKMYEAAVNNTAHRVGGTPIKESPNA